MKKQQEKYSPYDIGNKFFHQTNAKHIKVEEMFGPNEKEILNFVIKTKTRG